MHNIDVFKCDLNNSNLCKKFFSSFVEVILLHMVQVSNNVIHPVTTPTLRSIVRKSDSITHNPSRFAPQGTKSKLTCFPFTLAEYLLGLGSKISKKGERRD